MPKMPHIEVALSALHSVPCLREDVEGNVQDAVAADVERLDWPDLRVLGAVR